MLSFKWNGADAAVHKCGATAEKEPHLTPSSPSLALHPLLASSYCRLPDQAEALTSASLFFFSTSLEVAEREKPSQEGCELATASLLLIQVVLMSTQTQAHPPRHF